MAGYTRQAAANISNGNVADADDVDLEFDALAAAFSGVSGHLHDGSTGNGPKISTLASTTTLELSDNGSTVGPELNLDRLSATPAASDFLGRINFRGNDSAAGLDTYASIHTEIVNSTSGAEIGTLAFSTVSSGTLATAFELGVGANFYVEVRPGVDNGVALGSTSRKWSDLFLADGGVINFGSGSATISESADSILYETTGSGVHIFAGGIVRPLVNDGNALGSGSVAWSDLFLASGSVINFDNGDVTLTHAANTLTFAGATSGYRFGNGPVTPAANDGSALGTSSLSWSDLFLASGSVINWNSGDITLTHTNPNLLTFAGATQFDFGSATLDVADAQGFRVGGSSGATYTTYGPSFTTITSLVPGSQFGGYIEGSSAGHIVLGIRDNGGGDSVSIISFNGTGAYSKLIAQFREDGLVIIPSTTSTPVFTVGTVSTTGVTYGKDISSTVFRSSRVETTNTQHVQFYNPNGLVGSISTNVSATAYNTSSDGRLKENFRLFDSGYLIDNLEAGLFDWKTGGTGYGIIAQDAREVFPDAISEDEDGWLQADYSKFVPILLREVKELRKRIAKLEN